MSSRTFASALLLFLALALPIAASAGECHLVAVAFEGKQDVLDVINLDGAAHNLRVAFFSNDATVELDVNVSPPMAGFTRLRISAKDLYNLTSGLPAISNSYVKVGLSGSAPFAATATIAGATRELGCVTP